MVKALLVPALLLMAALPPDRPQVSRRGGELVVRMPGQLLEEETISKQLFSALTTTFLVEISSAGRELGVAEIQVRYDLWDDVFIATRTGFDGHLERERLPTTGDLSSWWGRAMPLPEAISTGDVIEINLVVLPFSLEDEDDARSWLERSGGVSSNRSRSRGIVQILIGTTLRATPLARHEWKIRLVEARQ